MGQISRTVQCHSCWKHLLQGLAFCSCVVCLRPDEATIKKDQSKIPSFDSTLLSCWNKSTKGQEAWRNSMATRPLESNGCQKRSMGKGTPLRSDGKRTNNIEILSKPIDRQKILPVPGLPHDDRHLLHRTLASEAPVREHHHAGMQ